MKTTIDIPDELMIRAKKRAVELRRPLRELVIEGLQSRLSEPVGRQQANEKVSIRWIVHEGGTPPAVSLTDRAEMSRWLHSES